MPCKPVATSAALPAQPFFETHAQRVGLARQRFFDEGSRPSGLVGEHVIQSWSRCTQARRRPQERIEFDPVRPSRMQSALNRNRQLLSVAAAPLTQLEAALAGTTCRAFLTGPDGVIVHVSQGADAAGDAIMPTAVRVGINLDEGLMGTTAPGVVVKSGQPCTVLGAEHFFDCARVLQCAAAPIHDRQGRLAGVLDLTIEARPFGFDAPSVVGLYAMTIENRLLMAPAGRQLVLQFQVSPSLLGTPFEGLAGVDQDGRLAWMNRAGRSLLGLAVSTQDGDAESLFGVTLEGLLGLTRREDASLLQLPSGFSVWLHARLQAGDSAVPNAALAAPAPSRQATPSPAIAASAVTLGGHNRALIEQTLAACDGNVSRAARVLGVSRGLLYRHLRRPADAG